MFKFFVSSTFEDMQLERDTIALKVLPALKSEVNELGDDVDFRDLRWGINTKDDLDDEARLNHILEVCFREIYECRPFVIVLLGERYGSVPSENSLECVLKRMNFSSEKNFTIDEVRGKSYTALEIEYGPFADEETFNNTLFLIRKPSDNPQLKARSEEEKSAQENLIATVKNHPWGANFHYYYIDENNEDSIYSFIDLVKSELLKIMKPRLDLLKNTPAHLLERNRHLLTCKNQARYFSSNTLLNLANAKLTEETHTLTIYGEKGCGKSVLFSKLIHEKICSGHNAYPIYLDNRHRYTIEEIYAKWALYLRGLINEENPSESSADYSYLSRNKFFNLLKKYSENCSTPLILAIDDILKLKTDYVVFTEDFLASYKIPNVFFITTFSYNGDYTEQHGHKYLHVNYTLNDAEIIAQGQLNSIGKDLSKATKQLLLNTHGNKNPFYIGLLIKRLVMIDSQDLKREFFTEHGERLYGMNQIDAFHADIIQNAPSDVLDLIKLLVDEVCERLNQPFINQSLHYILCAPYGVTRKDLQNLCIKDGLGWRELDFSAFIHNLESIVSEDEEGIITFRNEEIKNRLATHTDKAVYCEKLLDYVIQNLPQTKRLYSSLFHFAFSCNNFEKLLDFIKSHYAVFSSSALEEVLLLKPALLWFFDCYKNTSDQNKLIVHEFIDFYFYTFKQGFISLYQKIYMTEVEVLEGLKKANYPVDNALFKAYTSLANNSYGKDATKYYQKAFEFSNAEEENPVRKINSLLDYARRSTYENEDEAIEAIKNAHSLLYKKANEIDKWSFMVLNYEIYNKSRFIEKEIDGVNENNLIINAFLAFCDISLALNELCNSNIRNELLRPICYVIENQKTTEKQLEEIIDKFLSINDICDKNIESELSFCFELACSLAQNLQNKKDNSVLIYCDLAYNKAIEIIEHGNENPSLYSRIKELSNIYLGYKEYQKVYKLCIRALKNVTIAEKKDKYNLYLPLSDISYLCALSAFKSEDYSVALLNLSSCVNALLFSFSNKFFYEEIVAENMQILEKVLDLFVELAKKTPSYDYENCFTHLTNALCMIISLKQPFKAREFISKGIFTYLNDVSNLTYTLDQEMWYILIRNCYLTLFSVYKNPYYIEDDLLCSGCKNYLEYSLKNKTYPFVIALEDVKEFSKAIKNKKNTGLYKKLKGIISYYKKIK